MSFDKLEKPDLLKIADEFGVELEDAKTEAEIVSRLDEDGVTWEMAKGMIPALAEKFGEVEEVVAKEEAKAKAKEPKVLVKMDRANASFEVRGHKFTQKNPFAIMAETDALYVIKNVEGFRRAAPEEAEEFYG
jgi:hypothetical protein